MTTSRERSNTIARLTDAQLSDLRRKVELWEHKDEEIEEHVFKILFRAIEKQMKIALDARAYEAYTYFALLETELKYNIPNGFRNALINAIDK